MKKDDTYLKMIPPLEKKPSNSSGGKAGRKPGRGKVNRLKHLFISKVNDNSGKMAISVRGSAYYIVHKKVEVKTVTTINPNSFQPFEKKADRTLIITAIVVFCGKEKFKFYASRSVILIPLLKMNCPVLFIEKEEDITDKIKELE